MSAYAYNEAQMLESIRQYKAEMASKPAAKPPVLRGRKRTLTERWHREVRKVEPRARAVFDAVGEAHGLVGDCLLSLNHSPRLSNPRAMAYLLLAYGMGLSSTQIAHLANGRHYTTILYGLARAREMCRTDRRFLATAIGVAEKLGLVVDWGAVLAVCDGK